MQKVSKYIQIKNDILKSIKNNQLKPGDKVDSESVLKKKYNVSTITVRKAFSDLINEGYLYGVQGVGTFVAKKQMIRGLTSISFSDELKQQGYQIDMIIDSVEEVFNEFVAEKLQVNKDAKLICVKRVRLADDEPIAYQISYLSSELLSLEEAQNIRKTKSFYQILKDNYIYPVWVNEKYSLKEIRDTNISKLMKLKKGSATFFAERTAFDQQENIIEYSETYFNKDSYSVSVNITV